MGAASASANVSASASETEPEQGREDKLNGGGNYLPMGMGVTGAF